jgi:NAD(P)-dependent dehydrogenase (short-subunit alcohol dehydrogenase family)
MKKLDGKVAVITGATSGMGLASAKLFVAEGAYVFITGRRQTELDEAVKAVGGNVTGLQGDASNLADLDRLYETIKAEKGHSTFCMPAPGSAKSTSRSAKSPKRISRKPSTSMSRALCLRCRKRCH